MPRNLAKITTSRGMGLAPAPERYRDGPRAGPLRERPMNISKPAVGAIAVLCAVAGAGSAYLLRPSSPAATDTSATSSATPGVEASEATVSDTAPSALTPAAAPTPTP